MQSRPGVGVMAPPTPPGESFQISVPNTAVGAIIGTGGANIKQMMRESGAFVNVSTLFNFNFIWNVRLSLELVWLVCLELQSVDWLIEPILHCDTATSVCWSINCWCSLLCLCQNSTSEHLRTTCNDFFHRVEPNLDLPSFSLDT